MAETPRVTASFEDILPRTLVHEGGWYDGSKAHDPNPTMKGVTQATYDAWRLRRHLPVRSVRLITGDELRAIYRTYWDAVQADLFGPLTGELVFDHAVNAGPIPAIRIVQRALDVDDDGRIGPVTREAIAWADDEALAVAVAVERLKEYCRIARNPVKRPALLAWVSRTLPPAEEAAAACLRRAQAET